MREKGHGNRGMLPGGRWLFRGGAVRAVGAVGVV